MQRPHVVQAVAQLDQQHADILAHRQQELAQVFRRALVLGHLLDLRQLGHPVDQPRDILAEMLLDIVDRRQRVFDRVVQQRGGDGFLVELEIGHQAGDFDRVAEIGIATGSGLRAVLLHGIDIGAVEHRLVGVGIVFLDPFNEFVLAQHVFEIGALHPPEQMESSRRAAAGGMRRAAILPVASYHPERDRP